MSTFRGNSFEPRPTNAVPSDRELLQQVAVGVRSSFRVLYERHGRAVYYYASSILGRGHNAEDAAQEVWIVLWRNRRRIRPATDSLLPWLLVTARHKALHAIDGQRHGDLDIDSGQARSHTDGVDPSMVAERSELQRFIDELVAQMSAVDQELFSKCIRDGHSYDSVSRELGLGVDAVKHRIARIRIRMRKAIIIREELHEH